MRMLLLLPVLLLLFRLLAHVSWSSRAVGLVPTTPGPQRLGWQGSAANGWAGQASPPTAGLSLWHIHPDFLPLHLSNANGLQVLLCALEEESAIKPVFSDGWVQMAKSNGIQVCHHVINAPRGCWPNWNARGDKHRRCTANGWCWCCLRWCCTATGWCWCCLLHRQRLMLHAEHLRYG